jgi:hypothetical protein
MYFKSQYAEDAMSNIANARRTVLTGNTALGLVLSNEEEAILIAECADDHAIIHQEADEVKRLEDVADALEDMSIVGDRVDVTRPEDVLVIESAVRLAVAGSDMEVEEVVPALEANVGKPLSVSTEALGNLARRIWDGIVRTLKRIWEKVSAFFYKIFGTVPGLRRAIAGLRERAKGVDTGINEHKTVLGSEVNALVRNNELPKNGSDVLAGLSIQREQNKFFMGDYRDNVVALYGTVQSGIDGFSTDRPSDSLGTIVASVGGKLSTLKTTVKTTPTNDSRFSKDEYSVMEGLPGNISVFHRQSLALDMSKGVLEAAESIRRNYYNVHATVDRPRDRTSDYTIPTLSVGEIVDICDAADIILSDIEHFRKGPSVKEFDRVRQELQNSSAKLTNEVDKQKDMKAAEVAYYRSAVKFNRWLSDCSFRPSIALVANSFTAIRAAIVVCNKSLSNYG